MILDVDAGNTRLKWRLIEASSGAVAGWGATATAVADFSAVSAVPVHRVRLSSVLGAEREAALLGALHAATGCEPERAVTRAEELGLTNAYAEPERLGVDRWLAMLAAYHVCQGAVCVVDVGTTMTFDVIDAGGMHLGGYIVPGSEMMMAAIYGDTGKVRKVREVSQPCPDFGRSTEEAVSHGALAMLLGLICTGSGRAAGSAGTTPQIMATGGGASAILEYLPFEVGYRRDLVLDGLALQLP